LFTFRRFSTHTNLSLDIYVVVQFIVVVLFVVLVLVTSFEYVVLWPMFLYILLALTIFGTFFDGWPYAKYLETLRLVLSVGIVNLFLAMGTTVQHFYFSIPAVGSYSFHLISIIVLYFVIDTTAQTKYGSIIITSEKTEEQEKIPLKCDTIN